MAVNSPYYLKYTDEVYLTKQGFFTALGSSLVEKLWESVVGYRLAHAERTRLRTASQLPFTLTRTDRLNEKFRAFEGKLLAAKEEYDKYLELPDDKIKIDRNLMFQCLKGIAEYEGLKVSEPTMRAMLSGIYQGGSIESQPLLAYRDFMLGDLGTSFDNAEEFFLDLYKAISGTEELISFYRLSDVNQGRAGEYAKFGDIESLRDSLEDFIRNDGLSEIPKAFLSMYFVDYVAPFNAHNALLATALCKKMLSQGKLGSFALLLPLETLLLKNTPKAKEAFSETAKTGDFTYVYFHVIETLTPLLEALLNELSRLRMDALRREFRSVPQEETLPEPEAPKEVAAPKPEVIAEVKAVEATPLQSVPEPPRVMPKPIEETPEEVAEIYVEEAPKKTVEEVPVLTSLPAFDEKSVFGKRVSLNDKEVRMAARYIVETHPDINKQQALFFASHCTLGRYYTIQDYKKAMKVAYETARTSMDRLATAKLYQKLRIKNKFVYTALPRGDKENL